MGPKEFGYRVLADLAGRRCQRDVDEFLVIRNQLNPIDLQKDQSGLQANPFVAVDERVVGNDVEKMCRCHLLQIAEREAAPGSGLARGFAGVRPCERLQRLRRGQALCSVLGRGSLEGERLRRGEASPGRGFAGVRPCGREASPGSGLVFGVRERQSCKWETRQEASPGSGLVVGVGRRKASQCEAIFLIQNIHRSAVVMPRPPRL